MKADPPTFAPSADAIEALARTAIARLPEPFRSYLADVVLFVEEFPTRK